MQNVSLIADPLMQIPGYGGGDMGGNDGGYGGGNQGGGGGGY